MTLRIREVHTNLTRHVVVRDGVAVRVVRHTEQGARERPVANGNQAGTALPQVLIPDFLRVVHAVNLAQARSVGGSHGLNVRVAVTRPAARPPNDARLHVVNLVAGALRPQLLDTACVPVNLLCRVELEVVVRVVVRAGFNCAEQRVLRLLARNAIHRQALGALEGANRRLNRGGVHVRDAAGVVTLIDEFLHKAGYSVARRAKAQGGVGCARLRGGTAGGRGRRGRQGAAVIVALAYHIGADVAFRAVAQADEIPSVAARLDILGIVREHRSLLHAGENAAAVRGGADVHAVTRGNDVALRRVRLRRCRAGVLVQPFLIFRLRHHLDAAAQHPHFRGVVDNAVPSGRARRGRGIERQHRARAHLRDGLAVAAGRLAEVDVIQRRLNIIGLLNAARRRGRFLRDALAREVTGFLRGRELVGAVAAHEARVTVRRDGIPRHAVRGDNCANQRPDRLVRQLVDGFTADGAAQIRAGLGNLNIAVGADARGRGRRGRRRDRHLIAVQVARHSAVGAHIACLAIGRADAEPLVAPGGHRCTRNGENQPDVILSLRPARGGNTQVDTGFRQLDIAGIDRRGRCNGRRSGRFTQRIAVLVAHAHEVAADVSRQIVVADVIPQITAARGLDRRADAGQHNIARNLHDDFAARAQAQVDACRRGDDVAVSAAGCRRRRGRVDDAAARRVFHHVRADIIDCVVRAVIHRIPGKAALILRNPSDGERRALALPERAGRAVGRVAQVRGVIQQLHRAVDGRLRCRRHRRGQHTDKVGLDIAFLSVVANLIPVIFVNCIRNGKQRHHRTAVQLADDPSAQAWRNAEVRAAGGDFTCTVSDLRVRRGGRNHRDKRGRRCTAHDAGIERKIAAAGRRGGHKGIIRRRLKRERGCLRGGRGRRHIHAAAGKVRLCFLRRQRTEERRAHIADVGAPIGGRMRAVDLIPRCVAANDGIKDFADESRIDAEPVVRARGRLLADDNIIRRCHAVRGGGGRSFRSRFRIAHVGDGGGSQPAERQHEGQRQESPHPMPAVLHQWFTSKFVRQGAKMVC